MTTTHVRLAVAGLVLAACGGYAAPNEHMAQTQAAWRAASEIGAKDSPQAALHLKLAEEEIAKAKSLMADGDNKRADYTLTRARADAELALALAKENAAKQEAQRLADQLKSLTQEK